jgi:hypothetical protein
LRFLDTSVMVRLVAVDDGAVAKLVNPVADRPSQADVVGGDVQVEQHVDHEALPDQCLAVERFEGGPGDGGEHVLTMRIAAVAALTTR